MSITGALFISAVRQPMYGASRRLYAQVMNCGQKQRRALREALRPRSCCARDVVCGCGRRECHLRTATNVMAPHGGRMRRKTVLVRMEMGVMLRK